MLREAVVEKVLALSWCLVAETEEVHENLKYGVLMCRMGVQPAILRLYKERLNGPDGFLVC